MRRLLFAPLAALAWPALAQPVVAPTQEPVGATRGENIGGYNLVQSFELGYRLHTVNGSRGRYRSDVNFGNGVRLLGSRLALFSREGHGAWADELTLSTQGLGNDPYQMATLRARKNKLYQYDLLWRSNDYFNPGLPISGGLHALDTTRRLQDHDFTFLPDSTFRVFAGFSRVTQDGPALSTVHLFDNRDDEFGLLSNVNRRQNEFRFGSQIRLAGFKLHWMRVWERFREDTPAGLGGNPAGLNPADRSAAAAINRREPYKGIAPSWRVNLLRDQGGAWAFSGRFTSTAGERAFAFDETASGVDRFGQARNRQILVGGNARRPVITAGGTLTLFPKGALVVTNHTSFHQTRMEGDARYRELDNATLTEQRFDFQYLGIRNLSNATAANWRALPWLALRGGYQVSERRVRSVQQQEVEGFAFATRAEQDNRLHAGSAGVRLQPHTSLVLLLDGELGRNDRPIYPISEKDYYGWSARLQWRARQAVVSASARTNSNFNSVTLFAHSSRNRQYAVDASWTAGGGFSLDAGYSKQFTGTLTGIAYFLDGRRQSGQRSTYLSNLHAAYAGVHYTILRRADLYAGYSHTEDAGDGRTTLDVPVPFREVQIFPMAFASPLARLSLRVNNKLRWNVGWQFYRYRETLLARENYRAHTGYTSLLWSF